MKIYQSFVKRIFDFIFAFLALIILFPLLIFISLLLIAELNGKFLFTQQRPGFNGVPFKIYKFRTMREIFDSEGEMRPDRERITIIGRFLRFASLDELPQLLNILKGDMSFVGPRPFLMKYIGLYTERQKSRHSVKPGITGLAQVSGRNLLSWEEKFEYDIEYVENISFILDLSILLRTLLNVIRGHGVNASKENTMEEFKGVNS
jgi:undecaprenyl phosphate N,N'-diacetylbacillosamine 1-phosphate transferase